MVLAHAHHRVTQTNLRVHRHRHPNIRCAAQISAGESSRSNPYNREGLSLEFHRGADYVRIAAKSLLPQTIAQHGYRIGALHAIFFGSKGATAHCFDSEGGKIISRNDGG